MKNKIIYVFILVGLIFGFLAFYFFLSASRESGVGFANSSGKTNNDFLNTRNVLEIEKTASSSDFEKISRGELSKHNSVSDCWVSFQGKVYDVTLFLPKHKGSAAAIAPYCGTSEQFERAFLGKHGANMVKVLEKEGVFKGILAD